MKKPAPGLQKPKPSRLPAIAATAAMLALTAYAGSRPPDARSAAGTPPPPNPVLQPYPDSSGTFRTVSTLGAVDPHGPFFQSLGTNGRSCVTCHQPQNGWSITPTSAQALFAATGGTAPLFRTVDGANSPSANVSTVSARRLAYSLLLSKGLIRIHTAVPAKAEFVLTVADDPYGHASAADLSLFRRPLPTTNLPFLSVVMWDGRESPDGRTIPNSLLDQANTAILTHEQGKAPSASVLQSLVMFEASLFSAQATDNAAGPLDANGGEGGPALLAQQTFYPGINDVLGGDPTGAAFDPNAFTLYSAWAGPGNPPPPPPPGQNPPPPPPGQNPPPPPPPPPGQNPPPPPPPPPGQNPPPPPPPPPGQNPPPPPPPPPGQNPPPPPPPPPGHNPPPPPPPSPAQAARASILRGEKIFDTRPIPISGVAGINDVVQQPLVQGTCTSCHDAPNVGSHSLPDFLNIGIADGARRTPDLPLYTLRSKTTGDTVQTTDPGVAMLSGKWADIGKFKVPTLRDLPARAPYFHNGSAASLNDVVTFYNNRFGLNLRPDEKTDLVNYLKSL